MISSNVPKNSFLINVIVTNLFIIRNAFKLQVEEPYHEKMQGNL